MACLAVVHRRLNVVSAVTVLAQLACRTIVAQQQIKIGAQHVVLPVLAECVVNLHTRYKRKRWK